MGFSVFHVPYLFFCLQTNEGLETGDQHCLSNLLNDVTFYYIRLHIKDRHVGNWLPFTSPDYRITVSHNWWWCCIHIFLMENVQLSVRVICCCYSQMIWLFNGVRFVRFSFLFQDMSVHATEIMLSPTKLYEIFLSKHLFDGVH